MRSRWSEVADEVTPRTREEDERAELRAKVAQLAATRPHTHKASPLLTTTELDPNGNTRLLETCACGCQRYVALNGCGRIPGSWT